MTTPGVGDAAPAPAGPGTDADATLITGLRARDEAAFTRLLDRYGPSLLRSARRYLGDADAAEEVVQETWLAVLRGIDRFEGRSTLRTWIFRILSNQCATRLGRDLKEAIPLSQLAEQEAGEDGPAIDPDRFYRRLPLYRGHWSRPPAEWAASPEEIVAADETRTAVLHAIGMLPRAQATVITLRDVLGFSSDEVCDALDITANNQRVLLHRARSKVRLALERELG